MKTLVLLICGSLLAAAAFARDRLVMVAPFDNFSGLHRYTDYELETGTVAPNPRKFRIDRYSQAPRELLEHVIQSVPGLKPVERARFDRVMVEVSGALNSFVDPESAQAIALKLGADAIIMGSILDLKETTSEYTGYAHIKTTIYSATIRVRLVDLTKDKESGQILAAITSSYMITGKRVISETPYYRLRNTDFYFSALQAAFERLASDAEFKAKILPSPPDQSIPGLASVEFAVTPANSSVSIAAGSTWEYVGGSPLTKKLKNGVQCRIRVEKQGFLPWETLIEPENGLRVTHELAPLNSPNP